MISGVAGYLQLGFLVFGAYELEAGRPPRRLPRRLIPALALMGLATALPFVADPDAGAWRYFARVGLRALVAFAVCLVAGLRVWESRLDAGETGVPRLGPKLVGLGFFAYGLAQLQYVVLALVSLQWMRMQTHVAHLGWLDSILQWTMGLGMVVCLLEEERRSAV